MIDSSSAILLFKCGLFKSVAEFFSLNISESVQEELTKNGYDGADLFMNYIRNNQIKILRFHPHEKKEFNKDKKIKNLDIGESDTIYLFYRNNIDFIIIDDGKGVSYCLSNDIPNINALLIPRIFYLKNIITEKEFCLKTDELIKKGRYSKKVIDYAKNSGEENFNFFYPENYISLTISLFISSIVLHPVSIIAFNSSCFNCFK